MTDTMDILGDFLDRYKREKKREDRSVLLGNKNKPETKDWAINIIIDASDSQNPIFVEIETDDGRSINIGTRIVLDDGLTRIRITVPEIIEID